MNDYSRLTKAQLIEELEGFKAHQKDLVRQLDNLPPGPRPVPEAQAIASCIRALDELTRDSRSTRDPFSSIGSGSSEVARVLKMLAEKYRVNLVEVRIEPCSLEHVQDIDMSIVADTIRNSRKLAGSY